MITYNQYTELCVRYGEEKANRWFPRTIAAMWRERSKNGQ